MPFDGIFVQCLCDELQLLIGTRVDKIHQPTKDELVFHLRGRGGSHRLLLCVNQSRARAGLITQSIENPPQPTMFCMLLRKHLMGAKLTEITQPPNERILKFSFAGTSEIGEPTSLTLSAEFTGRHANLIVIREDGTVLDALRRVDLTQGARPILPGLAYQPPPPRDMPFEQSPAEQPRPYLYRNAQGVPVAFSHRLLELNDVACEEIECFSRLLELFYGDKDRAERMRQRRAQLLKLCQTRAARARRKAQTQQSELEQAQDREHLRVCGELILSNRDKLEQHARGASAYRLENYYDENRMITIPADPAKSPAQNAQHYFKRYRKAKTAAQMLSNFIEQAQLQADYLESVADLLLRAETQAEIDALRTELEAQGYVKKSKPAKGKQRSAPQVKPIEYRTSEGLRILVGRNNLQNEQLSFQVARGGDLWFHVKDYPGSHVILCTEGKTPSQQCMEEAAMVAAWHSKAGGRVAVDYTPAKALKKPAGAAPGQVIYHTYNSMIANPTQQEIKSLLERRPEHGRD